MREVLKNLFQHYVTLKNGQRDYYSIQPFELMGNIVSELHAFLPASVIDARYV